MPAWMRATKSLGREESHAFMLAANLMETTWKKAFHFEFVCIVRVDVISAGNHQWRKAAYEAYKASLPTDAANVAASR